MDVEQASGGRFGPEPQSIYDHWAEFAAWGSTIDPAAGEPYRKEELLAPVPRPRQIIAVGLNYKEHLAESGLSEGDNPIVVFTKFASSLTGPYSPIERVPGDVDWEAEMVVVVGAEARRIPVEGAWDHVAGLTIGQDISERALQLSGGTYPQFSLAKSHAGFAPTGPFVVTPDELADRDDLAISTEVNGEVVQSSRTSMMIHSVPEILSRLSEVLTLYPGDLIFTGTPSGVGSAWNPPRFLAVGDELRTSIEGLGEMRNLFTAPESLGAAASEEN